MKLEVRKSNPENARAEADYVLAILNRWDQKMQGHQRQKRSSERVQYGVRITLYNRNGLAGPDPQNSGLSVWSRNVSQGGIGFIYKGRIPHKRIVLCLDPDAGENTWFRAEIVRARQVHQEFWEYGARFVGRTSRDEVFAPKESKGTAKEKSAKEPSSPPPSEEAGK